MAMRYISGNATISYSHSLYRQFKPTKPFSATATLSSFMKKKMSSFDHKPKTNHVDHSSLQKPKYPSFSFIDYSNPNHNKIKNLSSTTNDAGKQKIIWFFSYSVPDDVGKQNKLSCDVCNKVFTSNKALNGHMICHSPTAAPSSFAQSYDDQFLPPKKRQALRRRSYMNNDDAISRGGFEGSTTNINVNHRGAKRQKLCCYMTDDNNKKKEQDVLLTSAKGKICQTSQDCKEPAASNHGIEEKKINEGETELGSKVVKNFDLNELPSDDLKNFDLNKLPSDDFEYETN